MNAKHGALRSMFDDGQFCGGYVAEAFALILFLGYAPELRVNKADRRIIVCGRTCILQNIYYKPVQIQLLKWF